MAKSKAKSPAQPVAIQSGDFLARQAVIDGVDALAKEMEKRWGVDRLRLLVEDEWRERFDRQRAKLNAAVWNGTLDELRAEGQRMRNAWLKLAQLAEDAGQRPLERDVWETAMPDGTVLAIVRTAPEAFGLAEAAGRQVRVYTLEEIARLVASLPEVSEIKRVFPGATITAVREPLDPLLGDLTDDQMPIAGP